MAKRKIWLLALPASLYVEDVKNLAKSNNLIIVDAKFADAVDDKDVEQKPPKTTLVNKLKRKPRKKLTEPEPEEAKPEEE